MNTTFSLMASHGKAIIPLSEVCDEYFGCNIKTAVARAKAGSFPVPAFQSGSSQKSPWLVHVTDLAKVLDESREKAVSDWHYNNQLGNYTSP